MAYEFKGIRYDCGDKLGYLKATVECVLKHLEFSMEFKSYLMGLANKFGIGSRAV
jgi:UTP--glucose-1-phosphate uridylyltransferase